MKRRLQGSNMVWILIAGGTAVVILGVIIGIAIHNHAATESVSTTATAGGTMPLAANQPSVVASGKTSNAASISTPSGTASNVQPAAQLSAIDKSLSDLDSSLNEVTRGLNDQQGNLSE